MLFWRSIKAVLLIVQWALINSVIALASPSLIQNEYQLSRNDYPFIEPVFSSDLETAAGHFNPITDKNLSPVNDEPVRNLDQDPQSQEYLRDHKAYISLTTSPLRIKKIHEMLESLDLSHIEKVYINLPYRFGRDNSLYRIPDQLLKNPKVKILRISNDYGPITKMIPSNAVAKKHDPGSLVISVDDDIAYPKGMVNELIFQSIHHEHAVVSSSGGDFPDGNLNWDLPRFPKRANFEVPYQREQSGYVDFVEGYGAIIYRSGDIDVNFLKALSNYTKTCFVSDDLVISFALAIENIPRMNVWNKYFNRDALHPLSYGLQGDALHHGAGLEGTHFEDPTDVNSQKYKNCYAHLIDASYDMDTKEFRTKDEILKRIAKKPSTMSVSSATRWKAPTQKREDFFDSIGPLFNNYSLNENQIKQLRLFGLHLLNEEQVNEGKNGALFEAIDNNHKKFMVKIAKTGRELMLEGEIAAFIKIREFMPEVLPETKLLSSMIVKEFIQGSTLEQALMDDTLTPEMESKLFDLFRNLAAHDLFVSDLSGTNLIYSNKKENWIIVDTDHAYVEKFPLLRFKQNLTDSWMHRIEKPSITSTLRQKYRRIYPILLDKIDLLIQESSAH